MKSTGQSYASNILIKTIKMESEIVTITLGYKRIETLDKNIAITVFRWKIIGNWILLFIWYL